MRNFRRLYSRFNASTCGVAAIEFAIMLPILAVLFLELIDAGRAIAIYMKVRTAAYTLDAITNQYTTIAAADMSSIVGATSVVLAPYSSSPAVVTISQISVNTSTNATVSWSYSLNGTALAQGASVTLPSGFSTCSTYPCFLVYGQVSYRYAPMFGYFPAITFKDNLYVTPRSSKCILYAPGNVTSC